MRRHQNTLYVTTQGAYVARRGEALGVRVEDKERLHVPIHMLEGLVCFGRVAVSPAAMGLCAQRGVTITFLSERGRFLARVEGPISGNVLLRREQYRRADEGQGSAALALMFVTGKVLNCRTVLRRAAREHPETLGVEAIQRAADRLACNLADLKPGKPLDVVRGLEGDGARVYFEVFDRLIVAQKETFFFRGRSRRPPLDNMNALLSFLYTVLLHDCRSALETVGLDPSVGFLHRDRPGRPGLGLDLAEEFRPYLGDRLALSLVNTRRVRASGFRQTEAGGVVMDDETRKTVITAYQERKKEQIIHPFLAESTTVGLLPHLQARLLAGFLRGDLDAYPPFVWR